MKALLVALLMSVLGIPALAEGVATIPVVRLDVEKVVAASPEQVWAHLTEGSSFVTWCPVWKNEANRKVRLTKVGDVLEFLDSWGNGGRSVVTFLEPQRELRVTHEPTNGSYLCQAKLTLTAEGERTRVHYREQYTDESAPADREATAQKTLAEMEEVLEALGKQAAQP